MRLHHEPVWEEDALAREFRVKSLGNTKLLKSTRTVSTAATFPGQTTVPAMTAAAVISPSRRWAPARTCLSHTLLPCNGPILTATDGKRTSGYLKERARTGPGDTMAYRTHGPNLLVVVIRAPNPSPKLGNARGSNFDERLS